MTSVFLYVPNIIGYLRVGLVVVAWLYYDMLPVFLPFYLSSVILDVVDGYAARYLDQTSAFGAWLDVWVDNISRSLLWTSLNSCGVIIACLEWTVFVCTHSLGSRWKEAFGLAPWWVKAVMANGFYTLPGALTIAGIHGLPVALYLAQKQSDWVPYTVGWGDPLVWPTVFILATGRTIGAAVEVGARPSLAAVQNCSE
eukprot:Em0015g127a